MSSYATLLFQLTLLLALTAVSHVPTMAPASVGLSDHLPTWWSKFQALSSNTDIVSSASTDAGGVSVGDNIDVSNEPGPQSETSIAINPNNVSQLVAGSNEILRPPVRGYFSVDRGVTWKGVDLPLPPPRANGFEFASDPGVAWDTRGNVYYSYIVLFVSHGKGFAIDGTEMAVARSSDGGQNWASTYFALEPGKSSFNDKPMITVDTSPGSPFPNTVYVAWDVAFGEERVLVSHSVDGARSFSAPISAGPRSESIGSDPFVGTDGILYVAWNDFTNDRIVVSSSNDMGRTFGPAQTISPTRVSFDVGIPAMNVRRALVYPACGAGLKGSNWGTLYCSWMDETPTGGTDIFLSTSTDRGVTWSLKVRVNDDPQGIPNDQFNQWLSVDPSDGSVNLSWDDTRNDLSHVSTDIFYAHSTDGGRTFTKNLQVTTAPTNEACCGADGNQYGDYEGIAALNGSVHPVWTDRRTSLNPSLDEEVFTATITARV